MTRTSTAAGRALVLAVLVGLLGMHALALPGAVLTASGTEAPPAVTGSDAHSHAARHVTSSSTGTDPDPSLETRRPSDPTAPHEHQLDPCAASLPGLLAAATNPVTDGVALRWLPPAATSLADRSPTTASDGRGPPDLTRLCISRT